MAAHVIKHPHDELIITVVGFMTKVRLEHCKRRELVNVQIIAFRPHQSTVHSTDLHQPTHLTTSSAPLLRD